MKKKYQITKIDWIDKDIKEANVTFTFNGYTYTFFSHPCDFEVGEKETLELSGLVFNDLKPRIIRDENIDCFLSATNRDTWSYRGIGKVISLSPLLIDFNGIIVDLDDEISDTDLAVGNYIEVDIGRLDGTSIDE
jgi:hypothetical protein